MTNSVELFNVNDETSGIFRKLAEGITTRIHAGEKAMLSVVELKPGAIGTVHDHPEEQWGFLIEGSITRYQGDATFEASAGDFWRTPGGVPHTMRAGPGGAKVLDIFAPIREAYLRPGEGFAQS